MKILGWNINQQSGNGGLIPELVFDEIETCNSDILVLTEYVKTVNHNDFCNFLNKLGYRVFTRSGEYKESDEQLNVGKVNEILIAIKDSIKFKFELNMMPETEEYPNFLNNSL